MDWLMAHTACLVCLVSIVSGHSKNALGRGSSSNGHITKLEQSTFLSISMVCGEFIFLQIFVVNLDKLLLQKTMKSVDYALVKLKTFVTDSGSK